MSDAYPTDDELAALDGFDGIPWPSDEWPLPEYSPDLDWAIFEMAITADVMFAQATFYEFARAVEFEHFRIVKTYENMAIKAFFAAPDHPTVGEHVFLTEVFTDGRLITAKLTEPPRCQPELSEGQEVTFPVARLSDWFLVRHGKGVGGFTIPYVWSELSDEERQQFRDEPPFAWFAHRGDKTAKNQLLALRQCTQCNMRNIDDTDGSNDVCAWCQIGARRCNCPVCGAPLIRNESLPDLCIRCH